MFDNKGQSALEYLMTYGWALIVIAIVIGVLIFVTSGATSGVTCNSSSAFNVVSSSMGIGTGKAQITLQNITGDVITLTGVTPNPPIAGTIDLNTNISNVPNKADYSTTAHTLSKNGSMNITADGPTTAQTFQGAGFTVNYTTKTGLAATSTIICSGSVS